MQKKFGIVKKMVIGITAASAVTYGTSAFFLLVLKDVFSFLPGWLFVLLTLVFGVFWTGLFGYLAAKWLLRPLLSLTMAAEEAAKGISASRSSRIHRTTRCKRSEKHSSRC